MLQWGYMVSHPKEIEEEGTSSLIIIMMTPPFLLSPPWSLYRASELGILSTGTPRLITSFFRRSVPKGTNGGMSIYGTFASVAGGAFIGIGE